jgi:2-methylcitrate dehydratase PrpD
MSDKPLLRQACEWAVSLRLADIPPDVRDLARAQLLSMDAAVHATLRHPVGDRLLAMAVASASPAARGWAHDAACHALLTMALDFDEAAFAGHLGHACAIPPLLVAAEVGADGASTMTAQVAAAEVAARVTASVTLGSARGQTAAHTHAAAAVVGCGLLLGFGAEQLAVALSLALAQPRRVLPAAFMATDAKFWVAAGPLLDASRSLALAAAGGRGIDDLVEVHGGLLDQLAAVPLPGVFSGWGERWHLRTLSIKAIPGCAYLTSAVEAAASLAPIDLGEVESVEVGGSIFTLGMEAESAPYMRRSQSPLPALGFSVGYNVAAAMESGRLDVDDLYGERLASTERWELAGRLRLVHDPELTVRALSATAPVGAAIGRAGESARAWLLSRGATDEVVDRVLAGAAGDDEFEHPSKRLGARLRVRLRDGRMIEAERDAARGCCQESVADRLGLAEAKFLAQARPRIGARAEEDVENARRYEEMTAAELRRWRGPRLHPAVSGNFG